MSANGMRIVTTVEHSTRFDTIRSTDGGASWSSLTPVSGPTTYAYKGQIAGSRGGRFLTAVWIEGYPASYVRSASSTDGAATWSAPRDVSVPAAFVDNLTAATTSSGLDVMAVCEAGPWSTSATTYAAGGVSAVPVFATASSVDFGSVPTGSSADRQLTITNPGTAPLAVQSIDVDGPFTLVGQNCAAVAPSGTCTVTLRFAPTAAGPASGQARFTENGDYGTPVVALSGTGMTTPVVDKTTLQVKAGKILKAGKKSVLIKGVASNGEVSVTATCSLKGKKAKLCHVKVKGTRVTAKPACTKRVKVTVMITASKPGAEPATWTKTWKAKAKKPIRCLL